MDPKIFLAENVLNERRTVTYRSLSRALKVHANRAKQVLYEFHRNENAKKPQSVHATYVISGVQNSEPATANGHANEDEDEVMQSSPYMPSSMPNQEPRSDSMRITSIILAREEDLDDAKATFNSISTIHVYSVQSTVLQDLNVLTDVAREVATANVQDDPLECGKQWGMIQNRHVKRRTGTRPPPPPAAPKASAPAPKIKPEQTVPAKRPLQSETSVKSEAKTEDSKPQPSSANDVQSSAKSTASAPKREKGNLFSSFAKAKPKKSPAPAAPAPSATPDGESGQSRPKDVGSQFTVVLDDASDEEQEELFPDTGGKSEKSAAEARQTKKEREEKLKQMMETDDADGLFTFISRITVHFADNSIDEEMPDADGESEPEPEREQTPVDPPLPSKPMELKEEASVQGGRRRGKRQVMKKRTVKDEEGYLGKFLVLRSDLGTI
ncbi:hypothetical protein N7520_007708 [Penicillium odoratum]|uniref:uncharacterized protein n=1 Tax=Penicillium odoratum TaxID=1167516 RepID=UPI0025482504|nr:uncharacterized protein N7520_007708 [Penicillium odoratum]KAJ5760552.1 hypothetical protein N7520_007708 [Penicillium odoratum]